MVPMIVRQLLISRASATDPIPIVFLVCSFPIEQENLFPLHPSADGQGDRRILHVAYADSGVFGRMMDWWWNEIDT